MEHEERKRLESREEQKWLWMNNLRLKESEDSKKGVDNHMLLIKKMKVFY